MNTSRNSFLLGAAFGVLFLIARAAMGLDPIFDQQYCPAKQTIQKACSKAVLPKDLFNTKNGFSMDERAASYQDKCRLWWWASEVHKYNYPPLTEFAENLQDVLMERGELKQVGPVLGFAPKPPLPKLSSATYPESNCHFAIGSHSGELADTLQKLDFRSLNSSDLRDLMEHCLAFQVATVPWKRMEGNVLESYIIPIGDINIVIAGEAKFSQPYQAGIGGDLLSDNLVYSAVGVCSVTQEPRSCIESFISKGNDESTSFDPSFHHELQVAPYRTDVDGLLAYRWNKIRNVDMTVGKDGHLKFTAQWKDPTDPRESRTAPLRLSLTEGHLALVTEDKVCGSSGSITTEHVYLRPLAFGKVLEKLYDTALQYKPKDFPAPDNGSHEVLTREKGCPTQTNYSAWAAETANLTLHMANHAMPFDNLYRAIASERRTWQVEGDRAGRSESNAVAGEWRNSVQETALFPSDSHEKLAKLYVQGTRSLESDTLYRRNEIDGWDATEIWYYRKPQTVGTALDVKSNIMIHHLKEFNHLYASSVIARLVKIEGRCNPLSAQKKAFLKAMYALFNAAPLQAGDGTVGKIFMAVSYQQIFGQKLSSVKGISDIDVDALIMNREDFEKRYLPLL